MDETLNLITSEKHDGAAIAFPVSCPKEEK